MGVVPSGLRASAARGCTGGGDGGAGGRGPAVHAERRYRPGRGPRPRSRAAHLPGAPQHAGGRVPPADRQAARGLMSRALAIREFRFWLTNYRRTWRGSIYSSVLNPVLYLGAMGLGLGALVDRHGAGGLGTRSLGGVSYLVFLAPGLLAAGAMQTAMGESTYPVLGSVKWLKTYQAAAATPLRPADIFHGHLLFTVMRLAMNSVIFVAVMAAFGAVRSPGVLAAVPLAGATRLAVAAPRAGYAVSRAKDQSIAMLFRVGVIPP